MAWQVDGFATLMALEAHGPDVYVGVSPEYSWGRVYGGQVVAQGLRAAQATTTTTSTPSTPTSSGGVPATSPSATRWTGSVTGGRL